MSGNGMACVILAAGKGTRMRSAVPKVLHRLAGRSMLAHVLDSAAQAGTDDPVIVIGPDMQAVEDEALAFARAARVVVQKAQRGTADAVRAAKDALGGSERPVVVLFADTPLIRPATIERLAGELADGADMAVLGFRPPDPTGYGRLVCGDGGEILAIREELDASEQERRIGLCNSGVMAFRGPVLFGLLEHIGCDNAKGEFYLSDAVAIARREGHAVAAIECDADEVIGINSRAQLAEAEAVLQSRLRAQAMAAGATLIAPETIHLAHDTAFGTDVLVEPNVMFGPGVTVGDRVIIKSFSHIEGAAIAADATVGPFARLRPGAEIGAGARIGNFVEIKQAAIGPGAKVNHLSYVGDARVGREANVGAGTITCNYDGFAKHRTEIGPHAFIGSNSALVAPVRIGEGAYVGSGSVITADVEADALALARGEQVEKRGWAARFRTAHASPHKTRRKAGKG